MGDRRRRRRRSDVSSEDEDIIWSGSEATASQGSEYESGRESDQTDEELSRLNETPATDKEDNGIPTPDVQSDAEKEDTIKQAADPVEKKEIAKEDKKPDVENETEDNLVKEEEDNEEEAEEEDEDEQSEEDKEKSDEECPTHVPKRGMFYQHDDRNYVNQEDDNKRSRGSRVDNTGRQWGGKKEKKWVHDMYDEEEQKPKEDWEKEKPRRRKREGPPRKHRESEFKHHVPREEGRGPAPNPYIQPESGETGNTRQTSRQNSREGRGRANNRSSEGQVRVGETDTGKDSYRRPNFSTEPGKPKQGPRDREDRSGSERRRGDTRGRSPETDRPDREDASRGRGGRRGGYKPQKFEKRDMAESYTGMSPESPVEKEPGVERGTGRRRGGNRSNPDIEPEKDREVKHRGRERDSERSRDVNRDSERDRERSRRRRGGARRPPRYRDYDSDEEDGYENEHENSRRPARRGRENEDEIWKQLEQLRLDQLRLGLDVQRVATQSRYREEGQGTVVGKGRSRHTRTSPNQNSLIYKIAQEKAQEMAANQSNSSPTDSDQEDRVAVAYNDPQVQQPHTDRSVATNISQPKFKSSTVQTEGEIVTVKPKRYSQRSKNVDPNALREKVRETMSMEGVYKIIRKSLLL
ncbi:hypothetical protein ACHWQZ_G007236 [Mnemiopsis leidyi]